MTNPVVLEAVNEVLSLEMFSVLEYVRSAAWPSVIEPGDESGLKTLASWWEREREEVEKLGRAFADAGGRYDPVVTFRLAPSRLNFATSSHLLLVVPAMIDAEIATLGALATSLQSDAAFGASLTRILNIKTEGRKAIATAATQMQAKREVAAKPTEKGAPAAGVTGDLPWRDSNMPLSDRLSAAKGRPVVDRLWAAMAQTDCTACGYDCEGYARAIAEGRDKDLTKCVPGESETAEALRKLVAV